MKQKILSIGLMLLVGFTAAAQGTWSTMEVPGDELKGIEGGTHYKYTVEGLGEVEINGWDDCQVKITTYEGSFAWEEITSRRVMKFVGGRTNIVTEPYPTPRYSTSVLFGKYDNTNTLKDKTEEGLEIDRNQGYQSVSVNKSWFFYPQSCKKIRKILKTLTTGDGYVRIVIPRIDMPDFDIKITPYSGASGN